MRIEPFGYERPCSRKALCANLTPKAGLIRAALVDLVASMSVFRTFGDGLPWRDFHHLCGRIQL
jgi:hypothetical protein